MEDVNGVRPEVDQAALESRQLCNLFPKEVWHLVFKKVQDPVDLENLSNSSPFFREQLLSQRVVFLFPKVYELLAAKFDRYHLKDPTYNEAVPSRILRSQQNKLNPLRSYSEVPKRKCVSCGKTTRVFWFSGILKLRLVCRTWSNVIDARFQRLSRYPKLWTWDTVDDGGNFTTGIYSMTPEFCDMEPTRHRNFRDHFQQSHERDQEEDGEGRNPFLARSIRIIYSGMGRRRDPAQNFEEIQTLLSVYGHHLWNCKIITTNYSGILDVHQKVRDLLQLMPNLKSLEITGPSIAPPDHVYAEVIHRNPLPTIETLEYLVIDSVGTPIIYSLLRSNNHVSMMKASTRNFEIHAVPLSNLNSVGIAVESMRGFQTLENSLANWQQVTILVLDVTGLSEFTPLSRIFNLLSGKWRATLKTLCIKLPRVRNWYSNTENSNVEKFQEDLQNLKVDLPVLNQLKLMMKYAYKLDFLMDLKDSLEHLDLDFECWSGDFKELTANAERDGKIKILSCSGRLLESNIWELMPNMKKIKYTFNYRIISSLTKRDWLMERRRQQNRLEASASE